MNERILLVEDEKNVGSTLHEFLGQQGYEVEWVTTAADARMHIRDRKFDLVLLDVGLPDGSGFDVASDIRKSRSHVAIIFLTAFGEPESRIQGLELGAEDYIVKPFHLKELVLRIQNGLKRTKYFQDVTGKITIGQATVDFSNFTIESSGETHTLTQKECALLKFLVERKGSVVSRDEILNQVWSESAFPTSRTIDNFMVRLRRWIEVDPEDPKHIRSVRGVGYLLNV